MTINQLIERLVLVRDNLKKFHGEDDFEIQVQFPEIPGAVDIDFVSMEFNMNNIGKANIWIKED